MTRLPNASVLPPLTLSNELRLPSLNLPNVGKPPGVEQVHVNMRPCEPSLLSRKPECNNKGYKAKRDYRYPAHVIHRNWHRSGKAIQNVEENNPDNRYGVDWGTKPAEVEVSPGQNHFSTTIKNNGLRNDAGCLKEEYIGVHHGGESCCGAQEYESIKL